MATTINMISVGGVDKEIEDTYARTAVPAVNTLESEVTGLSARVDAIAQLPSGSTTGDAELIDIRVGEDGITRVNAGTSVREQIHNVKDFIKDNKLFYIFEMKRDSTNSGPSNFEEFAFYPLIRGRLHIEITNLENRDAYIHFRLATTTADPGNNWRYSLGGLFSAKQTQHIVLDNDFTDLVCAWINNPNSTTCVARMYVEIGDFLKVKDPKMASNLFSAKNLGMASSKFMERTTLRTMNLLDLDSVKAGYYYSGFDKTSAYADTNTDQYYVFDPVLLRAGSYIFGGSYAIVGGFAYYKGIKTGEYGPIQAAEFTLSEDSYVCVSARTANRSVDIEEVKKNVYIVDYNYSSPIRKNEPQYIKGVVGTNPNFGLDWWQYMDMLKSTYRVVNIMEPYTETVETNVAAKRFLNLDLSNIIHSIKHSDILIRFSLNRPISSVYEEYTTSGTTYDKTFKPVLYDSANGTYYYGVVLPNDFIHTSDVSYDNVTLYKLIIQMNIEASAADPAVFNLIDACYVVRDSKSIGGGDTRIVKSLITNPNWDSMTHISVKSDGTGDFTAIQPAINSITDASIDKQYVIDVYDDIECTDLTDLYFTNSPTSKNTSENPTSEVAMVVGKDWVHVRGVGSKKKLSIVSPLTLAAGSFQHVVVIRPFGNQIYENIYAVIQGGRYAIHHETSGSKNYHKTVMFRNMTIQHMGNDMYPNSDWASSFAQANGTTSGTDWYYDNCEWIGSHETYPYYTHQNMNFDAPCNLTFKNCRMYDNRPPYSSYITGPYFGDLGSNQTGKVSIEGCSFPYFTGECYANTRGLETSIIAPDDVRQGGSELVGHANEKMVVNQKNAEVLVFRAEGHDIKVTGGSAYDILWGEDLFYKTHTNNSPGYTAGIRRMPNRNTGTWGNDATNVYSLPARLGNCASAPKTLTIKEDDTTTYTITFNQNYMTSDGSAFTPTTNPYISRDQIIETVNAYLSSQGCHAVLGIGTNTEIETFDDCKRPVYNSGSTDAIINTKCYVYDGNLGLNGWKPADSNTTKDEVIGIPAEYIILPGESGNMVLADKAYFVKSGTTGTYYKCNDNAELVSTTKESAIFKQITPWLITKV